MAMNSNNTVVLSFIIKATEGKTNPHDSTLTGRNTRGGRNGRSFSTYNHHL